MIKDSMNFIKNEQDLWNSKNIADNCNLIYSQKISKKDFETYPESNEIKVLEETKDKNYETITYKKINFQLNENDIIFSHTDYVEDLFLHLKNCENFKNLRLITSQSDRKINKKLYNLKPDCISKWYGVNVNYKNKNLIPIPLGIADSFSTKNLNTKEIFNYLNLSFNNKQKIMYLNFRINTNYFHRNKLYKIFKDKTWVDIDEPNISKSSYLKKIKQSNFTLCPWGNGVDTHRLWEAIYLGSIPITKQHMIYKKLLPSHIVSVDSYKNISKQLITDYQFETSIDKLEYLLSIHSLFDELKKEKIDSSEKHINFKENDKSLLENNTKHEIRKRNERIKKNILTFMRKVHSYLLNHN